MYKYTLILVLFLINITNIFSQDDKTPTLVVGIVIDQMQYDVINRYWNKFGDTGFKKLINKGVFCKNTHYDYLNINSASGYATISCGSYPSQHGIINKNWYDRLKKISVSCISDKTSKPVGNTTDYGKSPLKLSSTTWTDQLRISTYKMSKVYSVGFNDYASILSGGKLANSAYWFDEHSGNWVTSSYYTNSLTDWCLQFNDKKFADIYLQQTWNTTYPLNKYTESLADKSDYELGLHGQSTFPYELINLKNYYPDYTLLKYTPYANTNTKDFAINLMINEYLGKDSYTDVLMINFAATGYIGDVFGIQSVEFEDAFIKLDKDISHLLTSIDDIVGEENVIVFLTSDQGACNYRKWLEDINIKTGEFNYKRTNVVLNSYLRAIYGMGNWIKGFYNNEIYFDYFDIDKAKLSVADIQEKATQMFVNFDGIETVIPTSTLLKGTFSSGIMKQAQNSYFNSRSGDLFMVLNYGWRMSSTSNKSLCDCSSSYNENTHVPLIFYNNNFSAQTVYRYISMDDLAVTLSFLLNIPLPEKSTGKPITEILNK